MKFTVGPLHPPLPKAQTKMMMIMYTNPLQRQPQRLVYRYHHALKFRSSATPKRLCRGAYKSISCSKLSSSSLTWPAIATAVPRIHQSRHFHQTRLSSSNTAAISDIEHRVTELERTAQSCRLTNLDVQHELWPLLANCTSIPTSSSSSSQYRSSSKFAQEQAIFKAKLSSRILELCLKEVEDRRVFLWDWLQTTTTSTNINDGNDNNNINHDIDSNNFSPTKFWNEAPHPTPQMFNLVLSSWKTVITDSSSSDQHSIQLMEHAAKQASSLLLQMEEEYSSDTAFIQEYNARVDKGRYTTLLVGAAVPDVRNYSEVIGVWGQCIDGGVVKVLDKGRDQRDGGGRGRGNDNNSHVRDGILQKRLRLEACAMKAMMELLESMEEDLYGTFSNSDTNDTTTATNMQEQQPRKKPPPDRVCYNIILASMARQLNPSLYEMRLVLQRMMERVQFELGSESDGDDDDNYSYAMSFFPDIFSYNALIEARANRAAMFTSETSTNPHQFDMQQQQQDNRSQSRWRQQLTSKVPKPMKSRFTSSEEEAILAEQMLEEINHISTVSVRPNIWSYNGESCVNHELNLI